MEDGIRSAINAAYMVSRNILISILKEMEKKKEKRTTISYGMELLQRRDENYNQGQKSLDHLSFLRSICLFTVYTAKLLFCQSPTRHSDYTVTTTVTM